jgi:hypothetical protein
MKPSHGSACVLDDQAWNYGLAYDQTGSMSAQMSLQGPVR